MKQIISACIQQKWITLFLTFLIAGGGAYIYQFIPKQENPDVASPYALLTTIYAGATPVEVERLVTKPIEDVVSRIHGFDKVESWSMNNASIILISLKNGAKQEKSWNEMRNYLDEVQEDLPLGVEKTTVNTRLSETAGMIIALSGESYSYDQLDAFAEIFKKRLTTVEGLDRFEIVGKVDKELIITIEHDKIKRYNISMDRLMEILQAQNINIPAGAIKTERGEIDVVLNGMYTSIREIEEVIIPVHDFKGQFLRIKDLAKVEMKLKEKANKIRQDGANAILLTGYFRPNQNIVLIGKEVREKLEILKEEMPAQLQITEVTFEPEDIDQSVSDFMMNLIQGMLLVIIIVFLGMGFRNAVVVSLSIPISILVSFLVFYFLNIKIHQVATASLIIALGMLVDNAIVISDAIQVRLDEGMPRFKAALEGTSSSAIPVLTATLTTLAAFSPLLNLPGETGEFLISIPQIVMISLSASYLVATLVTPAAAVILFKPRKSERQRNESSVQRFFSGILGLALQKRWLAISFAFCLFAGAIVLSDELSSKLFPKADKNIVYIDITNDRSDLNSTDRVTKKIEELLNKQPEILSYTSSLGNGLPRFYMSTSFSVPNPNFAQILMRIDIEKGNRFTSYEQFGDHLQKEIDKLLYGPKAKVRLLETTEPVEGTVIVHISGENMNRLLEVSGLIQQELLKIEGTKNVMDNSQTQSMKYQLVPLNNELLANGITKYDLQKQLNLSLMGQVISNYRKGGEVLDIRLKSDVVGVQDIQELPILSMTYDRVIPLKELTKLSLVPTFDMVRKYNKETTITVTCETIGSVDPIELEDRLEYQIIPNLDVSDVTISYAGERENMERDFGNLEDSALLAIVLIYLILLFQFKSFIQPLIILLSIPFSMIGSVLGLYLLGLPLSFTALLGVASLIGIVVNNAILLIDFINQAINSGLPVMEACLDAVKKRMRPILLSTTTTVMGLVPLAVSGSELFEPMAVALMAGLLFSTILTMVFIPAVCSVLLGQRNVK